MSKSTTNNIVRMDWLRNRTPTGKRSATKAWKLAQYLAFGRGRLAEQLERPQRGQWLDQSGQVSSHEDVLNWVMQQGKENLFTRQFILSVKDATLTPEAFNRAMAAGGGLFHEWRLIRHEDSRYPHAHALAFGQKEVRIKSPQFHAWWLAVRAALEQERQAQIEQQLAQGLQQQAEREITHQLAEESTAVSDKQQQLSVDATLEKSQQHGWGLG